MGIDQTFWFPGPHVEVDLPSIDACHPVHYVRKLLIFRCDSQTQREIQISTLKTALQVLVLRCPLLGGTIAPPVDKSQSLPAEWRAVIPGPGLELVVKNETTLLPSFDSLEASNFESSQLPFAQLMPIPQDLTNERLFAACKVQYTAINGGTIVTFTMSHSIGDGAATNELLRVLSEAVSQGQKSTNPAVPAITYVTDILGLDRSGVLELRSDAPFDLDQHPGYGSGDGAERIFSSQLHPFTATSTEVPVLKTISFAKLVQLKADAAMSDSEWISTHDALSALIWCIVIEFRYSRSYTASQLPKSTPCSMFMPSDARRHVNLPQSYVGNAVYQIAATVPLGTILAPDALKHAAAAVRQALKHATAERVRSLLAKSNSGWIPWSFPSTMTTTGVAMGTDWTSGMLYEQDWGPAFGPLIRVRYPAAAFNCVMPKLPDGSAELMISLLPKEIEELKHSRVYAKYFDS